MEQFRLKKSRKKIFVSTYILVVALLFGAGVYGTINIIANAEENYSFGLDEDSFAFDIGLDNYTEPDHYEFLLDQGIAYDDAMMGHQQSGTPGIYRIEPDENFVARYDATSQEDCQNSMGCVSQVENQRSENLCWAYSYTTAIESTMRNQLLNTNELSVKHLDYQLANNFLDDYNNPYYTYLYSDDNSSSDRKISGSANYQLASIVSTGNNTLVTEQTFWQNLKNADSALSSYNSYANYLENNASGYKNKISSDIVLGEDNSEINLTSYETASNFIYYGEDVPLQVSNTTESYSREAFIRHLKAAIRDYGAVGANTHYNKSKCGYTNINNEFTIIDKTTRNNTKYCGANSAHAITLVGWDDNWLYQNNGEEKKGAFIIQNSYGPTPKKEYLAYESAITGFFIATEVEENNYDHVYDYTKQQGSYVTNTNTNANYQLSYNSPNNITPASNDLIFEFNTEGQELEKLEKISFSQRFKMSGNVYTAYISTDGGESWDRLGALQYFYPGLETLNLSNRNIHLEGQFAIKIHSGYVSEDGCVVKSEKHYGTWKRVKECTEYVDDDGGLTTVVSGATSEPIDYEGEDFVDSEKKYDLVNVYTSDVVEENEYTVTFATNNENYVTLSKTSINVPDGATITKNGNTLNIKDSDDNVLDSIVANLNIEDNERDDEHYEYLVSWDLDNSKTIHSDNTILAKFERKAKKFTISFNMQHENEAGGLSQMTYSLKKLEYGVMPVYKGQTPQMESSEEGVTYEFTGWEPEITPVTENANYYAQFRKITSGGSGENDNPGDNPQGGDQEQGQGQNNNDHGEQSGSSQNNPRPNGSGTTAPSVPSTSSGDDGEATESEEGQNNSSSSGRSSSRVANTGYGQTENNFIRADAFITAMLLGTIGFVIYIIKNRRHLRLRTT